MEKINRGILILTTLLNIHCFAETAITNHNNTATQTLVTSKHTQTPEQTAATAEARTTTKETASIKKTPLTSVETASIQKTPLTSAETASIKKTPHTSTETADTPEASNNSAKTAGTQKTPHTSAKTAGTTEASRSSAETTPRTNNDSLSQHSPTHTSADNISASTNNPVPQKKASAENQEHLSSESNPITTTGQNEAISAVDKKDETANSPTVHASENTSTTERIETTPSAETPQNIHPAEPSPNHRATDPKQGTSPWEQFMINTISSIRYTQTNIQHYCEVLFSKQGISLLIIIFGILLLNIVIWFAYASFKKEQSHKIKNLMKHQNSAKEDNQPKPLSIAYAEESSGDFDVFATSEGIPIKLDLAQAYINMGDNESAQTVLEDIIHQHRGKVVSMAQKLLKEIAQKPK